MSHVAKKQKTNNNNNMASTTLQSSTGSWVPYDNETDFPIENTIWYLSTNSRCRSASWRCYWRSSIGPVQ